MFVVHHLSQFVHNPRRPHWQADLHVVRYLKATSVTGLFFSATAPLNLKAYCDTDWATCKRTRCSITGYCIYLSSTPISWKSKKQTIVSKSSSEAEYRSLALTVCELQWISYLLKDFSIFPHLSIPLYCDNQSAIYISENDVFHDKTKHLEIDCHIVRDKCKE